MSNQEETTQLNNDSAEIHPLDNEWNLIYECKNKKSRVKQTDLKDFLNSRTDVPVATISSIEDFWGVNNNIIKPSELSLGASYSLFKKGIKPIWEDKANEGGGSFNIEIKNKSKLDEVWETLECYMIGESLEFCDFICGGIVAQRKPDPRISLWVKKANNKDEINAMQQILQEILKVVPIEYKTHGV